MNCFNCKKDAGEQGKIFAEVYVCEDCYAQATHFYMRLEKELKHLQLMAKEAIRISLLEGTFRFPEGTGSDTSKQAVLERIISMEERRAQKGLPCHKKQ